MNIDPNKVKQLILTFSELDEEYQKKLLNEAYKLRFMQIQKCQIQKEETRYKTEEELQKEIEKRSNESAKEAMELMDILKKVSDTDKAAMFMIINRLSGKANKMQEADISITINQKDVSLKEYLEKHIANADYDKAKSMSEDFINDFLQQS